jgi:biotin synthase
MADSSRDFVTQTLQPASGAPSRYSILASDVSRSGGRAPSRQTPSVKEVPPSGQSTASIPPISRRRRDRCHLSILLELPLRGFLAAPGQTITDREKCANWWHAPVLVRAMIWTSHTFSAGIDSLIALIRPQFQENPTVLTPHASPVHWHTLADAVLTGHALTADEGLSILGCPDDEILDLLGATFRVRRKYFGFKVHLYFLKNAKSGLCPEDCGYCSQSSVSDAEIPRYALLNEAKLMEGAARAVESQARTYCIVASGRGPSNREVEHIASAVEKIKDKYGLHICCCLGLLSPEQAQRLKSAGVDRINHNLNTSRNHYPQVCTTHTYDDRLATLKTVRDAGMELCSGVIVGMGERDRDVVDVALELRSLQVSSIPVNFLHAIDGTPLERRHDLDPRYCLKALCLFRMSNPQTEIRVSGGREVNLRSMQAMSLYAANSMFVSDYLTTKGQPPEDDFQMVKDLGFEIVLGDHESYAAWQAAQTACV